MKIFPFDVAQKHNLTVNDFCIYEKQMPAMRKKLHEVIRQLVDQKGVTITALANELDCSRRKIYRMYYGWDTEDLPQRWSKEEDEFIKEKYQKKTCKQIAEILLRTESGVNYRMKLMGLRKKKASKKSLNLQSLNLGQSSQ